MQSPPGSVPGLMRTRGVSESALAAGKASPRGVCALEKTTPRALCEEAMPSPQGHLGSGCLSARHLALHFPVSVNTYFDLFTVKVPELGFHPFTNLPAEREVEWIFGSS